MSSLPKGNTQEQVWVLHNFESTAGISAGSIEEGDLRNIPYLSHNWMIEGREKGVVVGGEEKVVEGGKEGRKLRGKGEGRGFI